ncbi:MAG: hypothetical protein SPI74_00570 [Eubacterium sp.]|nr:hypothetical protein [Eubacterium sp.]
MGKMKKAACFVLITMVVISQALPSYAAENDEGKIIRSYTYTAATKNEKSECIKDSITKGGDKYVLKDIEYKAESLSLKQSVSLKDVKELKKSIKSKVDGKDYTFAASDDIRWEKKAERKTLTDSIEYRQKEEVPQTVTKESYTLSLQNIEEKSRTESFTAPALFISYAEDASEYIFNGKKISIKDEPVWTGYEADVAAYLGVNGASYAITGASFTSANTYSESADGHFERTAIFTGTRRIPYYLATFSYEGEDKESTTYNADVSYIAKDGFKVTAKAIYEKEGVPLYKKVITFGGGILLICIATAIVIYMAKRKTKNESKEVK